MRFRHALAAGALLFVLAGSPAMPIDRWTGAEGGSAFLPDSDLQRSLLGVIDELQLSIPLAKKHLALSLVDVTDINRPRYAGLNDTEMMYAASLPKICALVAGFEQIRAGQLKYTPAVKQMFTRMIRYSSNADASMAIQTVGFDYISKVLTSPKYNFYDAQGNGGLWLGKAYGGPNDYWRLDPVHHLSHGATTFQVARFFLMLQEGLLVSPEYSAEMKEILSKPGIHHKFVKGLEGEACEIYRKSGTWQKYHADAALVEHGGKKYIAVALMEDNRGAEIFPQIIQKFDHIIIARR